MVCQQPDRYIGSSILMIYFRCVSVSAYLPWKPFCRYLRKIYDYKKFRVKFETVKLLSCKISYTSLWSVFNQHICGSLCVSRFEYQFQNILLHNIGIRIGEALTMCPECSHVRSSSLKCQIYTSQSLFCFFFSICFSRVRLGWALLLLGCVWGWWHHLQPLETLKSCQQTTKQDDTDVKQRRLLKTYLKTNLGDFL